MSIWLCILIGVGISIFFFWLLDDWVGVGTYIFLIVACPFFVWLFFGKETEYGREWRKAEQAREAALARPHVIREADGCKTYRTKIDGQFHYYTRCGDQTTHTTPRTVPCGKNCTRTEIDSVTTTTK